MQKQRDGKEKQKKRDEINLKIEKKHLIYRCHFMSLLKQTEKPERQLERDRQRERQKEHQKEKQNDRQKKKYRKQKDKDGNKCLLPLKGLDLLLQVSLHVTIILDKSRANPF